MHTPVIRTLQDTTMENNNYYFAILVIIPTFARQVDILVKRSEKTNSQQNINKLMILIKQVYNVTYFDWRS